MYQIRRSFLFFSIFALNTVNANFWGAKSPEQCTQCNSSMLKFITAAHETWKFHRTKSSVTIIADPETSKGRATGGSLGKDGFVFSQNFFQLIKLKHEIYVLCTTDLLKVGYTSKAFALQDTDAFLQLRIFTPVKHCVDNPGFNDFAKIVFENEITGHHVVLESEPSYKWLIDDLSSQTPYVTFKSCSKEGCRTIIEIELPPEGAISFTQAFSVFDPHQIVDYFALIKNEHKTEPEHGQGIISTFN